MPKPAAKKPKPDHRAKVAHELHAFLVDQRQWLAHGIPARPPITAAQLKARVRLLTQAHSLIEGK